MLRRRDRFPAGIPRVILAVIVRRSRAASPAGNDLLDNLVHLVLLDDLDPFVFLVGIGGPALVFLMLLYLFLLLGVFFVLLLGGRLLFGVAPRVRPGADVLLLMLPAAAAAGTFLALPTAPLHLHVIRAGTVRRFGTIRGARTGAALVLFLRFAHPAAGINIRDNLHPNFTFAQIFTL